MGNFWYGRGYIKKSVLNPGEMANEWDVFHLFYDLVLNILVL